MKVMTPCGRCTETGLVPLPPDEQATTVARATALTFDDGPSPRYTPLILARSRKLHVRATFFLVGYLADQYPALVRSELRAA